MLRSWLEICWDFCLSLLKIVAILLKSWVRLFYVSRVSLRGEVVLLTGAAGGIGSVLARKLAKKGAVLLLWDIDEDRNNRLASEIRSEGGQAHAYCCDVTCRSEVARVAERIRIDVGKPTILINNAGVVCGKYFMELTPADVERTFRVNTIAHYWTVREFLPAMLDANHGHIVSVASIFGVDSIAGVSDYGPSKFAAVGFMKSLRQELRIMNKDGIYCSTVLPYHAATDMFCGTQIRFKTLPFLNVLSPEQVADAIIDAVEKKEITVFVPRVLYALVLLMSLLPDRAFDACHDFLRTNYAMKTFLGKKAAPCKLVKSD